MLNRLLNASDHGVWQLDRSRHGEHSGFAPSAWCKSLVASSWRIAAAAGLVACGSVAVVTLDAAVTPQAASATGSAPTVYVTDSSNEITPIDSATNTTEPTIPTNGTPWWIALNPSGTTGYVVEPSAGEVDTFDTATAKEGASFPISNLPNGIAIAPDGQEAFIANDNADTVTPVDLATNTPGTPIPVGLEPTALAMSPDGQTLYVSDAGGTEVTPVDAVTNTAGSPIDVSCLPTALAVTPNGSTVYVLCPVEDQVVPIDTSDDTAGSPIAVGSNPFGIAITPNGSTAYVTNESGNSVTPIDLSTDTAGTAITVGTNPLGIAITPDGSTAYVANGGSDSVTPISTATNTAGTAIPVGGAPWGVAITPDQGPQATLSVTPAPAGSPSHFDASASTPGSSPIVSYAWTFGDGGTAVTTTPTTTHTYTSIGIYTATVTETDQVGTSTSQVFTGQTVSRNGSSAAQASDTITSASCAQEVHCSAQIATAEQSVTASGTSSTTATMDLSDTVTTLDCGKAYDYPVTVATLTESDFTSSSGISIDVDQAGARSAKGVKICYQPVETSPPKPAVLKKCSSKVSAPCYTAITETSGSVDAQFTVPAGDPRFWVGTGNVALKKFSPTSGSPGTIVTIKGKNLCDLLSVQFGPSSTGLVNTSSQACSSQTSLKVTVPTGAQTGAVRVATEAGVFASTVPFTVSSA